MKRKILHTWKNSVILIIFTLISISGFKESLPIGVSSSPGQMIPFGNCSLEVSLPHHRRMGDLQMPSWSQHSSDPSSVANPRTTFPSLFVLKVSKRNAHQVREEAERVGFQFLAKVFKDEDYYLFRKQKRGRRSVRNLLYKFVKDPRVEAVLPQNVLERESRFLAANFAEEFHIGEDAWNIMMKGDHTEESMLHEMRRNVPFNDPLYQNQWYLENRGQSGSPPHKDINVFPVWRAGIDGRGVLVSVLDDGVNGQIQELALNYEPALSFDFIRLKPQGPDSVSENSHGTSCAAIVAGVANNHRCGVGVAFGARIGGPIVSGDPITDVQEAMSLVHALNSVDIYTASWGPKDDGRHLAGPGPLAQLAFMKGITQGRSGLGVVYVWAAGNGALSYDNCNADGYASSIYTLTFGALTDFGLSTYYTEPCSSVIASTYIGGFHYSPDNETIDRMKGKAKVVVPEGNGQCRTDFQGTSASAPMAAGAIALLLQANPMLSWRDVQHIVIESSPIPSADEPGWSLNSAGKHFHPKVGFGALNAGRMVALGQTWSPVPPLRNWTSSAYKANRIIRPGRVTKLLLRVREEDVLSRGNIRILESVMATVNLTHPRCKDLDLFLVSPAGTVSQIFSRRYLDNVTTAIPMWGFTSLHFWGESPFGSWKLCLSDKKPTNLESGIIGTFQLILFGTSQNHLFQKSFQPIRNLRKKQLLKIMKEESSLSTEIQK